MSDLTPLRDEIALREASLRDARREREAGELTSEALAQIELREHAAIEIARERLAQLEATPRSTKRQRVRRRRWLLVAIVCFALVIGIVLWSAIAPRQAGNSITGSISLGHAQQITQLLSEAEADTANNNLVSALAAYDQVLVLDPNNVTALTQAGWLDFSAGSSDKNLTLTKLGESYLRKAVGCAPRNPAPRLYYAIVAYATPGNRSLAVSQFKVFVDLKPSRDQLVIAAPFLKRLGLKS